MKRIVAVYIILLIMLMSLSVAHAYDFPSSYEEALDKQKESISEATVIKDSHVYDAPNDGSKDIGRVYIGDKIKVYKANIVDDWNAVEVEDIGLSYIMSDAVSITASTYARDKESSESQTDESIEGYPGEVYNDEDYLMMIAEAKKYIGMPYVFGGSSPKSSFDCSGYVCYVLNETGLLNVGRTNAQGLYNMSDRIDKEELLPGDLMFYEGTYEATWPVTHVAIYVGNGYMLHAGDPIGYSKIDTPYWREHLYGYGRII